MKISQTVLGILLSAIACAFFTLSDSTVKILGARYPVFEIMTGQFFLSAVFVLLYARITEGANFKAAITPHKKYLHLWRAFFQFTSNALITLSFMHMSLAEFYVILFLAPLLVALMSGWFLKEKPPSILYIVMLVSFAGVVVALRPASGISIWALVAFMATATNAITSIFVRKMAGSETTISPAYTNGIIVGLLCGVLTLFNFTPPTWADIGIIVLCGLFSAGGYIFLVRAFKHASAPFVAVAQFLQLPYGALVGFVLFSDVPSVWIYIGGSVVIGANLFLLYIQNKNAMQPS